MYKKSTEFSEELAITNNIYGLHKQIRILANSKRIFTQLERKNKKGCFSYFRKFWIVISALSHKRRGDNTGGRQVFNCSLRVQKF